MEVMKEIENRGQQGTAEHNEGRPQTQSKTRDKTQEPVAY